MMRYTKLEERVDTLTPSWVVATGRRLQIPGDDGEEAAWRCVVPFHGGIVHRSMVVDGGMVDKECKCGKPDFVVMSKSMFERYQAQIALASQGMPCLNPFMDLGCASGWYIEVNGRVWHEGKFTCGLTAEEHEAEVVAAYKGVGAEVLVLWEEDVFERWDEACAPRVREFLKRAAAVMDLPDEAAAIYTFDPLSNDALKSLGDAAYWLALDESGRSAVVDELVDRYGRVDFPWPDIHAALNDWRELKMWQGVRHNTHGLQGVRCCDHFIRSRMKARVKGKPSMLEMWADKALMRKSVIHQLTFGEGAHNAKRFFNGMAHSCGFRMVTGMRPTVADMLMRRHRAIKPGMMILDPCAGWGGRMLAACSMGCAYRAIDANKELVGELNHMAKTLRLDAKVVHGSAADPASYAVLEGVKADFAFTSPPFFDEEIYSDDAEQSFKRWNNDADWQTDFLPRLIDNVMANLVDDGTLVMDFVNTGFNFHAVAASVKWKMTDVKDYSVKGRHAWVVAKNPAADVNGHDFVVCKECGGRFKRLGRHLRSEHGTSKDEYRKKHPGFPLISAMDSARVARENLARRNGNYTPRHAFILPDGTYTRKKDKAARAYGGTVPESAFRPASEIPKPVQVEGVDYVACGICGHKGGNLTRHVKEKHAGVKCDFPLACSKIEAKYKEAAGRTWKTRRALTTTAP